MNKKIEQSKHKKHKNSNSKISIMKEMKNTKLGGI